MLISAWFSSFLSDENLITELPSLMFYRDFSVVEAVFQMPLLYFYDSISNSTRDVKLKLMHMPAYLTFIAIVISKEDKLICIYTLLGIYTRLKGKRTEFFLALADK